MEKKILKAIRKVLKETRYEDLKNNIESRRNRDKTLNYVLDSIEITKSTIKDVLSLNFSMLACQLILVRLTYSCQTFIIPCK